MIKDIQELNFPKLEGQEKSYATMSAATVSLPDMGEWIISSQIKIDGQIIPDFSYDWEVVYDGHKYIMPLREPQGSKENTTLNSVIDLTFQHWAQYQLKRWYFFAIQSTETGVAWPDKYIASVSLNLGDFCKLFGQILEYYYGDTITIDFNDDPVTGWQYKAEPEVIEISYSHIWDVLIKLYEVYGVRWVIETNGGPDKYVIKVGYGSTEQSHVFEYGFKGGLLKVERQVQSDELCNMLLGRGGEKNLPYRYFKNVDPENDTFKADPDWIEELANIYFSNLMPATFRSYVQGWKAAHISKYPGYTAIGEANAYAPWAYRKGYTDSKFDPVEYVTDEIVTSGSKYVAISPTYQAAVREGSSIDKYGPLLNGLDNNDEIYPTIQGISVNPFGRIDQVVYVEEILSDDVEEAAKNDAQLSSLPPIKSPTSKLGANQRKTITLEGSFTVAKDKTANLITEVTVSGRDTSNNSTVDYVINESTTVSVIDGNGKERSASGIPEGSYTFKIEVSIHNTSPTKAANVTVACQTPKLMDAEGSDSWSNVWYIWVKNIWNSAKGGDEDSIDYAERVWRPILGDREGNEAKIVFSSGMLATSEDYEFTIVGIPEFDDKKDLGGVPSHWKIPLAKSEADLESLGVYVPSTKKQAEAGDFFFFIGIDMPHQYTLWGEERVDNWKKDNLKEKKDIKPTWVVQTDRVRLNGEGEEDALIRLLHPGDTLRLADKRFIKGTYETLYLSSITKTYREPTSDDAALNPDVEIVLSDHYEVSANPVATLQGEVSALAKQVGSISNVEQIVRAVGDKLYLRKDGIADRSMSPTEFASLLTSMGFRSGMVGGAGWGIYKDANGNWVIEADRFMARQDLEVNNLVINQVTGQGGTIVESAARMEITRVEDTTNGYKCYFDQHEGTVANLFHVDDVAWNNRFTPKNADLKFYRRRVTEVGADYVLLSKTDVNGAGIPAEGDVIVQYGNYIDETRRFVKIRDVIGGGYERYIEGVDSVNAEGVEYYFVGRINGESPRWFIGNKDLIPYSGEGDGSYIEYKNRRFNLNNVSLSITSTIGNQTFEQYIKGVVPPVTQEDIESYVNAITNPKFEGIQNQIDGVIETWFYNGVPTLSSYPASEWNTDALKIQHLGDLYYDNNTGTAYRFSQNAQGGYYWNTITDDAITKALAAAQKAQETANNKRRTFVDTPVPPYDKGDIWVNATYETQYSNDILRCVTAKAEGSVFNIADWTLASKYTDDSALNTFINNYEETIGDIQGQLDGKAQTWYQATDPSKTKDPNGWLDEDNLVHKGDLWYCTADIAGTNFKKGTTWYWTGTAWQKQDIPQSVFDTIDGKANIYVKKPTTGYHKNDLWFLEAEYTLSDGKHAAGTLAVAIANMGAAFSFNDWAKKDRYTDDSLAQDAIDKIAGYEYLKEAIQNGATTINGGLLMSSLIKLGTWNLDDPQNPLLNKVYAGMNGVMIKDWSDAKRNKTVASWWGGDMVDRYYGTDGIKLTTPLTSGYAAALVRMDGSAYFSGGNIGFEADGSGWLGDRSTGNAITFANGSMTFGNGIKINLNTGIAGLTETIESIANIVLGLKDLLVPCDANNAEMDWGQASKATTLKAKVSLWSVGELTALGSGGTGSGSSGGGGGASYNRLDSWDTYTSAMEGYVLSAKLGWDLYQNKADKSALSAYATTASLANYVDKTSAQTITGRKTFKGGLNIRFDADTSNAVSLKWLAADGTTVKQLITAHNTANRIILNPTGAAATYDDAVGKYSLIVGSNELTYNTYSILHAGNYATILDTAYVKKSGDTLTGPLTFSNVNPALIIKRSGNSVPYIRFSKADDNTLLGDLGASAAKNLVWWNDGKWNTIWHSGNDGAGSGLDADLLDGFHASFFVDRQTIGGATSESLLTIFQNYYSSLSDSQAHAVTISKGSKAIAFGWFLNNPNLNPYGGWFVFEYGTPKWVGVTDGVWIEKTFAFTDSNVASATRLATTSTYTVWGQTYFENGVPKSVDGVFRELITSSLNGGVAHSILNNSSAPYGLITRIYGSGAVSLQAQRETTSTEYFPLYLNPLGGNIAVGKTTADYKLDVNGTFRSTGNATVPRLNIVGVSSSNAYLTADSDTNIYVNVGGRSMMVWSHEESCVRPANALNNTIALGKSASRWSNLYSVLGNFSGQVTVGSIKIGDGTITWDATNGAFKFDKPIYSLGEVTALGEGGGVSGGSSGGTSYNRLDKWSDYTVDKAGYVLSAALGYDLYSRSDINVKDIRATTPKPSDFASRKVAAWFNNQDKPGTEAWYSGLSVHGWTSPDYAGWQIAAGSSYGSFADKNLYFRVGLGSTWDSWQKVLTSSNYSGTLDSRYVTLDTAQTISGVKTFTNGLKLNAGTSSQFLKADGSVDSNNYALASALNSYVTLNTEQTIWGKKNFTTGIRFVNTAPDTTGWGGNAGNGLAFWRGTESDPDTNMQIGVMTSSANLDGIITSRYLYLGWGNAPYSAASNFSVCADFIKYKNQDVLHTGNYASILDTAYVKKSGDTMTGPLTFSNVNPALIIKRSGNSVPYIRFSKADDNTLLGDLGASAAKNLVWWYDGKWNTIWHSGNDGENSGLDADMLDGVHNGSVTALNLNIVDSVNDFNATLNKNGIYTWGANVQNQPHSYGAMLQWSNTNTPVGGADQHWITQLASSTNNRLYYRTRTNAGAWHEWSTLAFTTDNVASATRLQGTYSLWGQSFYGNNVSGDMTGVGSISPVADNTYNIGSATVGFKYGYMRWIGAPTNASFALGANNGTHITIDTSGKVGVNTPTPSELLDVNGTANASKWRMRMPMGGVGENYIQGGAADRQATFFGDDVTSANLEIYSHWGIAFKTSCEGQSRSGKIAVGIDTRNGDLETAGLIRCGGKLIVRGNLIEFGDGYTITVDKTNGCFIFSHTVVSKNEITALG